VYIFRVGRARLTWHPLNPPGFPGGSGTSSGPHMSNEYVN